MFGFGKKKPKTALDEFIFAVYGNPPPPKRANIEQAVGLACDKLLLGLVDGQAVRENALALAATPIPYSTHDLAISTTLNFFKDPRYIPLLGTAQLAARIQAISWTKEGLVVAPLMKSFEDTLYKLYKPAPPPPRPTPVAKPIPAPDDQRHDLIRRLIVTRVGQEAVGGDINEAPLELILSTVDSAIFIIVETYYMFRDRGLTEADAIQQLNDYQANSLALVGQKLPIMKYPATLFEYVRHFLNSQFSQEPVRDAVIRAEIEVVEAFYGRLTS
jgi:hypothetical protein